MPLTALNSKYTSGFMCGGARYVASYMLVTMLGFVESRSFTAHYAAFLITFGR
jgi:hypothetical protein